MPNSLDSQTYPPNFMKIGWQLFRVTLLAPQTDKQTSEPIKVKVFPEVKSRDYTYIILHALFIAAVTYIDYKFSFDEKLTFQWFPMLRL